MLSGLVRFRPVIFGIQTPISRSAYLTATLDCAGIGNKDR